METLQTWVIAMSSSQIRSFRHTATVIALEVETALCEVAAAVEKEAGVVGRQKEGERKRKATNKGRAVREKDLDKKAAEVRDRRTKVAEYIKEFVDGYVCSISSVFGNDWHNNSSAYSFTATAISIPVSVPNAYEQLAFGLKNTPDTS